LIMNETQLLFRHSRLGNGGRSRFRGEKGDPFP
jgi:hypothetical protein